MTGDTEQALFSYSLDGFSSAYKYNKSGMQ